MNRKELIEKMRAEGKTVGMLRSDFENWMAGLDVLPQGFGGLQSFEGYCCLGIEQKVRLGEVECDVTSVGKVAHKVPSRSYLEKYGIVYLESDYTVTVNPHCNSRGRTFAAMNDNRVPFSVIKELLRESAYLYDEPLEG